MTTETTNPDVTVSFNRRQREQTCWIELYFPVDAEPTEMLAALAEVGFAPDGMREPPPLDGVQAAHLIKHGSDLFGGWTDAEKRENMKAARAVLRRFGSTGVPVNALSYFDLA